ncbi:MAG: TonB-dependent receptor [Bryobacteraceae bacterium]|nr:TonB-dependent receptor [Bryobacteraceae bacterium]
MRRAAIALLACAALAPADRQSGELRMAVADPTGAALAARVEVESAINQVRRTYETSPEGRLNIPGLAFGPYRVSVIRDGFAASSFSFEIRGEVPVERKVTLELRGITEQVTVRDSGTLLDPHATGPVFRLGSEAIHTRRASRPGREILDLVNTQPGWLLEANGILHPRGSEYDTQYVMDGIPVTDNRSPGFAPAFAAESTESMRIWTAGIPAEFGRKLGGVVELTTRRDSRLGWRGSAALEGGSFASRNGAIGGQYGARRWTVSLGANGFFTDRFLDPPAPENFTNHGSGAGFTARLDTEPSDQDRVRFYFHQKRSAFLVPNELFQQTAGQRQDRATRESLGQASYQRTLSAKWLFDARLMARDVDARLWSNPLATPILASQDRGFRELYLNSSAATTQGRHAVKFGIEAAFTSARELFAYRIADPTFFEEEFPLAFRFRGRRRGNEQSAYVQDTIRLGNLTVNAGLRWDRYRLLVAETAFSPRLGIGYYLPRTRTLLRASLDRVFTTPAIENLLLASSPEARNLTDETSGLPVRPSRGNYFEAGFSQAIFSRVRLDASWYLRRLRNYGDDEVFLNTGVSFPIAFEQARVRGYEVKLEVPSWGRFSGFASYSNLLGTGYLPVTGGLFLDDAAELLAQGSFPITQDQRNTVQLRGRWDLTRRVWAAAGYWYNSGLPFEGEAPETGDPRVLSQVDFARGRVKPSYSFDLSLGIDLLRGERYQATFQVDALNVADRFNLINFAGLLSGTAIGQPRNVAARLRVAF